MALQASVGSECVTGVMTPMTPNGAYSWSATPFSPLKASVRRNSTPGMRSAMTCQLFDLVGEPADLGFFQFLAAELSRPARVQMRRMQATALRRSSRPRRLEAALGLGRGGDGLVHVVEDAAASAALPWPLRRRGAACRCASGPALAAPRRG